MNKEDMMKQMRNLLGLQKMIRPKEAKPDTRPEAAAKAGAAASPEIDTAELAASVDELAEMFCDSAVILSRISNALQGKKNPRKPVADEADADDEDWDDDDIGGLDSIVLFAVPGKPAELMTEEAALSRFPGFEDEQTYTCYEIREGLVLSYMDYSMETEEDITICGPVYIADVDEDLDEAVDLTAVDFLYALEFLAEHSVTITDESGKTFYGYWLPKKENKED